MTITTEYRPVDDATLAGILIGGIHEQEEPARIIRLAMDLATELQSAREEHDRLSGEMERMRGVVTAAVEALGLRDNLPMADLYTAIDLAVRGKHSRTGNGQPRDMMETIWFALLPLVALTTDGVGSEITHQHLLQIMPTRTEDYDPWGDNVRWANDDEAYPDCSSGCKWSAWLEGEMDWCVCANPASHRVGLLTFEHQGCQQFEYDEDDDE